MPDANATPTLTPAQPSAQAAAGAVKAEAQNIFTRVVKQLKNKWYYVVSAIVVIGLIVHFV